MNKKHIFIGFLSLLLLLTAIFVAIFLTLHFNSNKKIIMGPKILIDHDGGADDAMAIFIALLNEKFFNGPTVIGLTTTFGNVDEDQSFINSQRILNIINRTDIPIYRGSKQPLIYGIETDRFFGNDGLGDIEHEEFKRLNPEKKHAVLALIELSKLYEGDLTVVAIGSITNIALAIQLDPGFIGRLSHLYVGAGHVYSENSTEAEFNAAMDPESYFIISQNADPEKVTVIPFSEIKTSLTTTKEWRVSVLGSIPTKTMQVLNEYERISSANSTHWVMLDPAVMSIAMARDLVEEIKYSNNSIILCGNDRGINTNEYDLSPINANVQLVFSSNKEVYQSFLIDIFSAEMNQTA
ncbi:inosine-uridine preferring nucleoside hydrolase-like [Galleria mellonella]|uniref:Inosine-uridine preferring nucleoside hydrolase-like n=1 Tax=Galleria mellonella TaxID=7137 RepID=A0ABM3MR64_GALME|nr:inosine-uridine preferring nucleoside hydrolase-like [Galleria mellonella]